MQTTLEKSLDLHGRMMSLAMLLRLVAGVCGAAVLAYDLTITIANQVGLTFDSAAPPQKEGEKNWVAPLRRIVGSTVRVELATNNNVQSVVGLSNWLTSVIGSEPGPAGEIVAQQF